jgi:L,D-peptidoglycan transpeptidase YkuD (ErfK/YbiS/YcfS/YnhG family)
VTLAARVAVLVTALTACDVAHAQPARAPAAAVDDATASVIPATAQQLITGVIADWRSTRVTLRRWRRADGAWRPDGDAWQGVIGKGAAWGAGLHGKGAPSQADGPRKREGDGKSPAGVFALRGTYGYAARPPAKAVLPYTQVTADWLCIDDPESPHYTQILDRSHLPAGAEVDWKSAEAMRRRDALYTRVVDIAHNPTAKPGDGSCIFFHVWRSAAAATVGCTAMPEARLEALIGGLDPSAVYVLLPRAAYDAFAAPWGLPPRAP